MKQIARIGIVVVSVAFCARADVQTNTWISGSTDWSDPGSYLENRKPSADDAVVIPSGVTKLEEDAFEGCIALKQVTAPKHLEEEARICFPDAELIFV